jgi:hypothetical protein
MRSRVWDDFFLPNTLHGYALETRRRQCSLDLDAFDKYCYIAQEAEQVLERFK